MFKLGVLMQLAVLQRLTGSFVKDRNCYLRWAAWAGVIVLAMFSICEHVRLAMGAVSIFCAPLEVRGPCRVNWTVCDAQLVHLDLRWVFPVLVWPVDLKLPPLEVTRGVGLLGDGA